MRKHLLLLCACLWNLGGHLAAQALYDGGSCFVNGFARVVKGDHYFYIDSLGQYAFDRLPDSDKFSAPPPAASTGDDPATGKLVASQFSYIGRYPQKGSDWLRVVKNDKQGLVDSNGHTIIPVEFDDISPFSSGSRKLVRVTLGNYYGVYDIDKQALTIPASYEEIVPVENTNLFFVQQYSGDAEGLVDASGEAVCPIRRSQRLDATDTTGSFFVVTRKDTATSKITYAVLNVPARKLYPLPYDTVIIGGYKNRVGVHTGNRQYALYDIAKRAIVKGTYSENGFPELVYPYRDKALIISHNKMGIIGASGDIQVPAKYDLLSPFTDNLLMYVQKNGNGEPLYGYGDGKGNIFIPIQYNYSPGDWSTYMQDSLLTLFKKDKDGKVHKGYAAMDGKTVIPVQYEEITREERGKGYLVRNGKAFGIIGPDGKVILPAEFDNILLDDKRDYLSTVTFSWPVAARKAGSWRYYNAAGTLLPVRLKATINFDPPYAGGSEEKDAGNLSSSLLPHEEARVVDSPISVKDSSAQSH